MRTIDDRLDEIEQMLRMELRLPLRPAEGGSPRSQEDNRAGFDGSSLERYEAPKAEDTPQAIPDDGQIGSKPRGFDGDGTPIAHRTRSAKGLNVTNNNNNNESPKNSFTDSDNIPTGGSPAVGDNVATGDNSAINENAAANENVAISNNPAISDNVAANENLANSDNAPANESIETIFDPDSVDLATFPRCRQCFLNKRRCDGRTPCDKCRQRRCHRACRPVTVELLRQYSTRAERVLELARGDRASS